MDFMLGGIIQFGGNFAPKDWAFCSGQLVGIGQNQALYAILGTTWGGDGRTNFALPNLQGRVPVGTGRAPGLTETILGRTVGSERMTLRVPHLPAHTHSAEFSPKESGFATSVTVHASNGEGTSDSPQGAYWASGETANGRTKYQVQNEYCANPTSKVAMASDAVKVKITGTADGSVTNGITGGDASFGIMQPSIGINFLIAIEGLFPSRN